MDDVDSDDDLPCMICTCWRYDDPRGPIWDLKRMKKYIKERKKNKKNKKRMRRKDIEHFIECDRIILSYKIVYDKKGLPNIVKK